MGARSAASFTLATASLASAGIAGSLNTYGTELDAYTDEAQQIGLILAAHASTAAGAVRERAALQHLAETLNEALLSRDVIGQAKGILMERLKVTPEDAFDLLRSIEPAEPEAEPRGGHADGNGRTRQRESVTAPAGAGVSL